jgi:guanylate kinase
MFSKNNGMMFVLSSPSGAGKTTLTKKISANNENFVISISHTTRTPRPNEIDGKDYHFVEKTKFDSLIKSNGFFEHAKIFNNYYGTLKDPIKKLISEGKDVLFDIDWQGTQQLKKISELTLVTFFILPPNIEVLKKRLLSRHGGEEKLITERMKKFNEELSHWNEYNYVVVNDDLEECYNKILSIILSEKKGIKDVQNLNEIKDRVKKLIK